MYYEITIKCLPDFDTKKRTVLVDADNYGEAYSHVVTHLSETDEVLVMARRNQIKEIPEVLELNDGYSFYVCKVSAQTISDSGKPKKMRYKVVVQAPTHQPSIAARFAEELMEQGYDMVVEGCEEAKFDEILIAE